MKNCDMCGSEIIDSRCGCGIWHSKKETENSPFKKALEEFHEMRQFSLTGDAPHLGCACIFFRGDYKDTQKVLDFICTMKGRKYQEH
jgi:hypothetical protein